MTKEQIDTLKKDGDLIPGEGLICLYEKRFQLSKPFHETLEKIFEWYLQNTLYGDGFITGSVERFQIKIRSRMKEFFLSKAQKITFLNSKIQEEMKHLESLRSIFPWEQTIKDIKESWFCHIVNNKMENVIEVLKFQILKGEKIKSLNYPFINLLPNLNLLDEYFLSENMQEIYEAAAIEENVKFLQGEINEIKKENSLSKDEKELSAPLLALFCSLVNESSVCKQENESKPDFCKKICDRFGFEYRDRIRQNYTSVIDNYNSKNMTKVKDLILPLIDINTRNTINKFIDSKKLYG